MQVFGSGTGRTSSTSRDGKAGWWALGPFIYGAFFLVLGVGMFVGASAIPAGSGGLYVTGGVFVLLGLASIAFAIHVRRDIKSDTGPAPLRGSVSADTERTLKATGVAGSATIKSFKFLGGSQEGTTLVELQLDLTTTAGGTIAVTKQARVPIGATDKLAAGAQVPVTVSTSDPNQLLFDWPALVSA